MASSTKNLLSSLPSSSEEDSAQLKGKENELLAELDEDMTRFKKSVHEHNQSVLDIMSKLEKLVEKVQAHEEWKMLTKEEKIELEEEEKSITKFIRMYPPKLENSTQEGEK